MSNIVRHFFFFNDTATTEIYTLSLHDALPISSQRDADHADHHRRRQADHGLLPRTLPRGSSRHGRSEEHTSELQSLAYLVCRLLLEKKKKKKLHHNRTINQVRPYRHATAQLVS